MATNEQFPTFIHRRRKPHVAQFTFDRKLSVRKRIKRFRWSYTGRDEYELDHVIRSPGRPLEPATIVSTTITFDVIRKH
ncbi:uncharacterized protein J4E87_001520 [Alternaria ethzedia]|uniref:uncharacterized protein n=1 Tax=Alternaria ethzedia TaxID=181014 RepID=UPI0020C21863|nr:uncharacterized protein J4E87_001520 [Alternaria ethzedia]KAI4632050.1 hypothetical protein J4E87_001520 [Alternaria ethzedia]